MFRVLDIASKMHSEWSVCSRHVGARQYCSGNVVQRCFIPSARGSMAAIPPRASIIDGAGNLYGTTVVTTPANCGTVFRDSCHGVNPTLRLYMRKAMANGPDDSLVMDQKGNLYGATIGRRQHWLRRIISGYT